MKKLFFLIFLISFTKTFAANVTMAFGEKIPPFCFPETNSGIELEVVGLALAYKGHVLIPKYFPFARVPLAFIDGEVNAAMTDLGMDLSKKGGYYGEPAVFYDNVFITLKEKKIIIKKPEDLKGHTVISFPGAIKRYPKWLEQVKKDGNYTEVNNQELQVLTLNKGHYDIVLSDKNIFKYFAIKIKRETGVPIKEVEEHSFVEFNPNDYRPVFRDKGIRDDFNAGLKHIKGNGRYLAIYDKYLKE